MDKRVEAAARVIWDSIVWDAYTDRQQNARGRIVDRALAASDAAAWRPIETAPYREDFLAYGNGETGICHKDKDYGIMCSVHYCTISGITHWHPLPAPPSDATP